MAYKHYDYLAKMFPERIAKEKKKDITKSKITDYDRKTTINKKIKLSEEELSD